LKPSPAAQSVPVTAAAPLPVTSSIDDLMRAEWAKENVTPAPKVDDARWLRRVYIDLVGRVPPSDRVREFLQDSAPDKREKMVDKLLASPEYVEHWTAYWDDVLMGPAARPQLVDRRAFRAWLSEQIGKNVPWNKLVASLVGATGQNSHGGPRNGNGPEPDDGATINGAVNWTLRFESPQDLAGTASKTFLGVQIQCAQCHDHKTEKWKQTDFQKFAAAFSRAQVVPIDKGKAMGIRRVELKDASRPMPRMAKDPDMRPIAQAKPTALDGKEIADRPALASWMTDNPWFAQAVVNRMWGHFLGRGFVDPVDDIRPSNPATMLPLLDRLSNELRAGGYDLKQLQRKIVLSEPYALASGPSDKLWSRFRMTPMGPEELLRSIVQATDLEAALKEAKNVNLDQIRTQLARQYDMFDVDEELDHAAYEGTLAQALVLLNGSLVGSGSSALPGGGLKAILEKRGMDEEKIEELYLRTLSRKPTGDEKAYWVKYVTEVAAGTRTAPSTWPVPPRLQPGDPLRRVETRAAGKGDLRTQAYEDLLWVLLNSSEFLFNH
jgi:hypothetical protein